MTESGHAASFGIDIIIMASAPGVHSHDEEYRRWLVTELERFEQPVHLVGHDWGGAHVVNVAMTRPELLSSWVCDVIGLFDPGLPVAR